VGSSSRSVLGEKSAEVDRVALQLFEKDQQSMIGHSLRVENPVEVITFVLDNSGVKSLDLTLDYLTAETGSAIADPQVPRHDASQTRHRETALPAERPLGPDGLDHRVDQHSQILRDIAGHSAETLRWNAKYDDPVRLVNLRSGNPGATGILHRFNHVFGKTAHPGRCGVIHDRRDAAQNRMPHSGDFQ
jgi:hypothetical protein